MRRACACWRTARWPWAFSRWASSSASSGHCTNHASRFLTFWVGFVGTRKGGSLTRSSAYRSAHSLALPQLQVWQVHLPRRSQVATDACCACGWAGQVPRGGWRAAGRAAEPLPWALCGSGVALRPAARCAGGHARVCDPGRRRRPGAGGARAAVCAHPRTAHLSVRSAAKQDMQQEGLERLCSCLERLSSFSPASERKRTLSLMPMCACVCKPVTGARQALSIRGKRVEAAAWWQSS